MFYYLYEIRNNLNNKIYVGVHKTNNMDDGYMGSGKVILNAFKKYGIENFTKVILETFDSSEAMYAREAEVVNDEFLLREDVYNLRRGGNGGFDYINKNAVNVTISEQRKRNPSLIQKASLLGNEVKRNKAKNDPIYAEYLSDILKKAKQKSVEKNPNGTFYGKKHTTEHKKYMSDIMSEKQTGSKNSQFGTMWITDGETNKKIMAHETIPDGWSKGRIIKSKTFDK